MKKALDQYGGNLQGLLDEFRQMKAQQEDTGGVKALGEDIQVCRALSSAARRAANDKKPTETAAALNRLGPALISLRATLPAARVAEAVERAAAALNSYETEDAVKIASRDLMQAQEIRGSAPATLAPDILKDLESAKQQVGKSDISAANQTLLRIIDTLAGDESVRSAAQALATGRGAQEALGREAWGVVLAELDNLDALLAALGQKVEGAKTALAGEKPLATAGGETKPETPPTGTPPATEALVAETQPAAGTAPAPPATPAAPATGAATSSTR